jgi:hypothetical protein
VGCARTVAGGCWGRKKNGKKKRNISKICYFAVSFYVSIMRNIF